MHIAAFAAGALAAMTLASAAAAEAPTGQSNWLQIEASYKGDVASVVSGGLERGTHILGNGELTLDADLAKFGWSGARVKLHLLSVHGANPNDLAGTAQGINNIEADPDRTKLYQIWLEQSFAGDRASILVGMTDLNAEFYQNDAAGLLIAPAFGIGSELASTGPNGPSIFPSTAFAGRLRVTPSEGLYAQVALFNAKAGVLGDVDGVDFKMRDGALAIAEAGITRNGKLALGYWRYTKRQPDIVRTDAQGDPLGRVAQGLYLIAERPLAGSEEAGRQLTGFTRLGVSDGDTSPFQGGWQAGVLLEGVFKGRPDTRLSFGVNQAYFSRKFRLAALGSGSALKRAETGLEITYQHPLGPYLSVQPDLQYVLNPAGSAGTKNALIVGVRFTVAAPLM